MFWTDFHFLRPLWFAAFVPAVILLALLWKRRSTGTGWDDIIRPQLLQHLMLNSAGQLGRVPLLLLGLAWLLCIVSLAGPTWEKQPQPVYRASLDQVLVLDLSPSMARNDLAPDRVTRARFVINDLLRQTHEGRTALIVFGSEHHVVTPLTDDTATIEQLLRVLSLELIPAQGDRAAGALRAAQQLLSAAEGRAMHVVLLSDGVGDPADSFAAAKSLKEMGAKLSVIGFDPKYEPQLSELARTGSGIYQAFSSNNQHPALQLEAVAEFSKTENQNINVDLWVEKGSWLVLPLLAVAALGFRRGWLMLVLVGVLSPPQQAVAMRWDDLWLTPDQQAQRLLKKGQAQQAAELFDDPNWRATAKYYNKEFDKAAEAFKGDDPNTAYNRANALAKSGNLKEAIEHYDKALEQQPNDEDARFNRDLVHKLLEQQQQQQQQQQQDSTDQSSQNDNSTDNRQNSSAQSPDNSHQESQTGTENQKQPGEDSKKDDASAQNKQQNVQQETNQQQLAKQDVAPTPEAQHRSSFEERNFNDDNPAPTEQELSLQQWLRQIPDDPGGLLRRKFLLEHLRRQKEQQG